MIVYQSTKARFLDNVLSNKIDTIIHDAYFQHLGRHTSPNEVLSWSNSMMYMNNILSDDGIPGDARISIEFQIPLTSKRIDFIITGLNEDKKEQVIIIELKQWSSAELTGKDAIVKTRFQFGITETAHPSYQAWSYAAMIQDYNKTVQDEKIALIPCAYLHNYSPDGVISHPFYSKHITKAPLFLKNDAVKLRDFIKKYVKYGDEGDILYKIENGRIRPSKQLVDSLSSMLKGNREFIMIDDQKLVFETALTLAKKVNHKSKKVLIVEGGPGTGKSVVAINLLVEITKLGLVSKYISKNAAPRAVYASKLSGTLRQTRINNLFGGTGNFIDSEPNVFDVLIVDEAHRLNLKSGLYQNLGENQVLEIINASKLSIFFIDDAQRVHFKDIGSRQQIEDWAYSEGAKITNLKLESQFRCNGSDSYLAWLDNTLQIRETANVSLSEEEFDFRVFSDPNELRNEIRAKNKENNKSRLVAGYCWDWVSRNDSEIADVVIPEFNFEMKWNLKNDGSTWIIAENSINEIGCIHTCQGLELDYVGIIIGNDLRCEDGKIITDIYKRSSHDHSIRGIKSLLREDRQEGEKIAERIIKNTYRTLMTRGMKGCYVYFCDRTLDAHFRKMLVENTTEKKAIEQNEKQVIRIEAEINDDVKFLDFLPLYSIRAACGAFGEWKTVTEQGWVKVEGLGKLSRNMFVVNAIGRSMEPKINDGDLCVFRTNVIGSRNNKIVLVQHNDYYDSDNEGAYSIKKYTSKKTYDKDTGEWMHETIILQPLNDDYDSIYIEENNDFMVVGELVSIIKPS